MSAKQTAKGSPKRKRCAASKCRRLAVAGAALCAKHAHESANPIEAVKRLSELEKLRFLEADAVIRNLGQSIRMLEQERHLDLLERAQLEVVRAAQTVELQAEMKRRGAAQRILLDQLGQKYDFDPMRCSIDDVTGVIQEHKKGSKE